MVSTVEVDHAHAAPNVETMRRVTAAHDYPITEERIHFLGTLADATRANKAYGYTYAFWDPINYVKVDNVKPRGDLAIPSAQVDFAPVLEEDGDYIIGSTSVRKDRTSQYTLMFLQGFQNYTLMVDAGIIDKPEELFGMTNAEMAIFVERFGLLTDIARQHGDQKALAHNMLRESAAQFEVRGSYDEVRRQLFSDEIRKIEKLLLRRMSGSQLVGAGALAVI